MIASKGCKENDHTPTRLDANYTHPAGIVAPGPTSLFHPLSCAGWRPAALTPDLA